MDDELKLALDNNDVEKILDALSRIPAGNGLVEAHQAMADREQSSSEFGRLLGQVPDDNVQVAARVLFPVLGHIKTPDSALVNAALHFIERLPPHSHARVVKVFVAVFTKAPQLAVETRDAIAAGAVPGQGARLMWPAAVGSSLPSVVLDGLVGTSSSDDVVFRLSVRALGHLEARAAATAPTLRAHDASLLPRLLSLAGDAADGHAAWMAVCQLADVSVLAAAKMLQVAAAGPVHGQQALTVWLTHSSTAEVGPSGRPWHDYLDPLVAAAIGAEEVRGHVDGLLEQVLRTPVHRPLGLAALNKLRVVDDDIVEIFPSAVSAIQEDPSSFAGLLTEWLLAPEARFSALRSLLSRCISGRAPAVLDVEKLAAADDQGRRRTVRRLLGLAHNGPVVCTFAAVLAETPQLQPWGLPVASEMLDYLFVEYPGSAKTFLKSKAKAFPKTSEVGKLYRGVYAFALQWGRVLGHLPELAELRPSDREVFTLRQLRQNMNRDIMREAERRSIFAQVTTKVTIRQGRRIATHHPFGKAQVAELQQTGHFIELPTSELADPVGGMMRRAQMLRSAR
jgi:hypothetical protein